MPRIRERREQLGMRREELAAASGVSFGYLGMLERDEANPTLPIARKIAAALKTTVDDLFPPAETPAVDGDAA